VAKRKGANFLHSSLRPTKALLLLQRKPTPFMEGCEHLLELIIKSVFLVVAENQLQANTLSILSIIFNGKENTNFDFRQIFQ
jgi:hypothetical protein